MVRFNIEDLCTLQLTIFAIRLQESVFYTFAEFKECDIEHAQRRLEAITCANNEMQLAMLADM